MTMIRQTRRRVLSLGAAALLLPAIGRAEAVETISGAAFGTAWRLSAPSGSGLERLRPVIKAVFAEVDRQMSPWRQDSEVSRFNRAPVGEMPASGATAAVARASLALADRSGGAFDPTVGPLVARWGFGPITGTGPDWRGLSAHEDAIAKDEAGLTLDLCGIAKGWALDRALAVLREAGRASALMDLGGELAALGTHPSGRRWRVAVEHPMAEAPAPAVLDLPPDRAVATSGLKAQSYAIGGSEYGHIIDPARRRPAAGALRSVTVLAGDAMTADGWATALFAAGAKDGPALARTERIAALFLLEDGAALRQVRTGDIREHLL
jgi:thiamine biosynthesis lipoprotein